jgi:tetratricopeptide (TPR) repeat protein
VSFSNLIFDVSLRASSNARKKGRFDKAAKDLDTAVKEARQPGAPPQALTLSLLMQGVNYRDWANNGARDKFALSERCYIELIHLEQGVGGSAEEVISTKRLLGSLCLDWGSTVPAKLIEAERWLGEWLAATEDTKPEKAEVLFTLGQVLAAQGRRPEAEKPLTQALAITDATAGTESMGSAVLHHELGNFYWAEKRYEFAVAHLQWAVHIKEKVSGPNDPSLELSLSALSAVYKEMGDQGKSDEAMQRAMAIGRRVGR